MKGKFRRSISLFAALITSLSFSVFTGCRDGRNKFQPQDLSETFLEYKDASEVTWDNYDETYLNYPFFTDKEDAVTYAVNGMWDIYSNITDTDQTVMDLGHEATWYEWISRISKWTANDWRNGRLEDFIINTPLLDNGFVWNWFNSPHWPSNNDGSGKCSEENYHYDSNMMYILGVNNIVSWENDTRFLDETQTSRINITSGWDGMSTKHHEADDCSVGFTVEDKVDAAMNYLMEDMHGKNGLVLIYDQNDQKNQGRIGDYGTNYWDNFLFGYKDAYENILFYRSLLAMANIKRMRGDETAAVKWETHAEKVKTEYNKTFWDNTVKRYISWINVDGKVLDFGMTFLNMEAVEAGLADRQQIEYIYSWLIGNRIVESDIRVVDNLNNKRGSTGKDIYYFKIAPRVTTVPMESVWERDPVTNKKKYYFFDWAGAANVTTTHQYGYHFQNGGAIFYPSYYDIMNRAEHVSADNALNRLKVIANEFSIDRLIRRPSNPLGWTDMIGITDEFIESGLVPNTYLYAFIGVNPTARGLELSPKIPSDYEYMGVNEFFYGGNEYIITVHKDGKVEFEAMDEIDFRLVLKDYAGKKAVTARVIDGSGKEIASKTAVAENGEFVIDFSGANAQDINARLVIA